MASSKIQGGVTSVGESAPLTIEDFFRTYHDLVDGYKYEFNNGKVEKFTKVNHEQIYIIALLGRYFEQTICHAEGGYLVAEGDVYTSASQVRRPDVAVYTAEQLRNNRAGKRVVPIWVGEIISANDSANLINSKVAEYFKAGVQCVWNIYPASKQIFVYTAVDEVTICIGEKVCTGSPVLPDFQLPAMDLF